MKNQFLTFHISRALMIFAGLFIGLFFVGGVSAKDNPSTNPLADFDGDGKSDISVFRPSDGYWHILRSSGGISSLQWGLSTDTLVPGDYDGDGKTDLAVYRYGYISNPETAANNIWHIFRSSDSTLQTRLWGTNASFSFDTPVPADYDGDGVTDLAVYKSQDYIPAPGQFIISESSTGAKVVKEWGTNADKRVPADYDGDGKADLAVFRHDAIFRADVGVWYILQSSNNQMRTERFGLPTDTLVPSDYDADGKTDLAVWRESNGYWYHINSGNGTLGSMQFGVSDDKPVPADYDGDRKTDIAVFRPSTSVWYLLRSEQGFSAQAFGLSDDVLIPNVFVR
jgi:hypothetical protein